jgi:hypothetical protein
MGGGRKCDPEQAATNLPNMKAPHSHARMRTQGIRALELTETDTARKM